MEHYLVFDAHCPTCSCLAQTIETSVGGKLKGISIHSEQAQELLNQALPKGWSFAPYLISCYENRVRAWTGYQAVIRIGLLMGPVKAWQAYKLAWSSGVRLSPNNKIVIVKKSPRRNFIESVAKAMTLVAIAPITPSPNVPCGCAYASCNTYVGFECYSNPSCYHPNRKDSRKIYACYDPCGDFCGYKYVHDCCNCCLNA